MIFVSFSLLKKKPSLLIIASGLSAVITMIGDLLSFYDIVVISSLMEKKHPDLLTILCSLSSVTPVIRVLS